MASNREDEVIADSEDEYGGDAITSHHQIPILPPRSSPEKADTSSRNFFSTIETVSDFPVQSSEKVSSISDFTAPPQPPTSLISSITTSSIAPPILSEIVETLTSGSSEYPDKPKKRPRPRPRIRPPKPGAETTEQPLTDESVKMGTDAPTSLNERKAKIMPEVVVLMPPVSKKRPSTSAPPQEIIPIPISSSDVEEIPVQIAAKKRKLSNTATGSSARPVAPGRKSKTLLLSDEEDDDLQLKGSEPPKSPRLSLTSAHTSSLPTPKEAPVTAKPMYDDERFSDFDPSESSKAAKKPKSKAKAKKAQAVQLEGDIEGGLVGQAAAGPSKAKKPRKSKAKSKRVDDEGMDTPGGDGFKSKEFIQDSDDELGIPRPEPHADSPSAPTKANETREPQAIVDAVEAAPTEAAAGSKPEKPKKKRKSKVDKVSPKLDEALQQTTPADDATIDAVGEEKGPEESVQTLETTKGTTKKPKSKSRPSPQADSELLPNPSRPSEPCEDEPAADEASESPGNVGSTATPAKGSPAPTKGRPSTPMSSSSAGPRGSIPYWRRPNKPLAELLNQATPGTSARASGLHKSIRIAPLHMNRKPPPPPLPPIPKKKTAKKGEGSDSEDDNETPKVRLKRLAAEYESLEGMESKKAIDRRKEIVQEMARLAN